VVVVVVVVVVVGLSSSYSGVRAFGGVRAVGVFYVSAFFV
jgi:hypothetical protein